MAVAPETHPPCNALNTCEMIISHNIYRCSELGDGAPILHSLSAAAMKF